ncbi:hypothetical protein [Pseudalkalibacillus decolorationis]|nr:hypothetical protein [Pseudalkalibacillus decolorationis]
MSFIGPQNGGIYNYVFPLVGLGILLAVVIVIFTLIIVTNSLKLFY